jgi:hypothetical protein
MDNNISKKFIFTALAIMIVCTPPTPNALGKRANRANGGWV